MGIGMFTGGTIWLLTYGQVGRECVELLVLGK